MTRFALLAALGAGLVLPAVASAQVPPEIAAQIKAMGRVVDPPATAKIYAPLQKKEPYAGVKVVRDVHYGPGPKDTLDVFTPQAAASGRPVMIFVHGGAFIGGDKNLDGQGKPSPFYDNLMLWSLDNGMIGVNMNYELAPKAQFPVVQQDIATVIAWVQKNAAQYGGDPSKIFLWGHSAGATHVASYVGRPELYPAGGVGLKGAIITSGGYRLTGGPSPYFGDPSTFAAKDHGPGLMASTLPLFTVAAEYDPEFMVASAQEFNDARCKAGRCPTVFMILKDHGHMSESYHVNTADQSLTKPLLAFIQAHR
jgi:triacylglycerol lipase